MQELNRCIEAFTEQVSNSFSELSINKLINEWKSFFAMGPTWRLFIRCIDFETIRYSRCCKLLFLLYLRIRHSTHASVILRYQY